MCCDVYFVDEFSHVLKEIIASFLRVTESGSRECSLKFSHHFFSCVNKSSSIKTMQTSLQQIIYCLLDKTFLDSKYLAILYGVLLCLN